MATHPGATRLSRRELYDLVWSKPLDALAVDLGISDRGLAKVCASHSIPLPPQGYWLLKSKPARPALPTLRRAKGPIVIERRAMVPPQHRLRREARTPLADPPGYIATSKAHPSVRASVRALRQDTQIPETALAYGQGLCGVECRKVDTYRAVRLLDGLVRALQARGVELRPADDRMVVALGEDAIDIRLRGGDDGYFELWMVGHTGKKWRDTEKTLIEQLLPWIAIELEAAVRDFSASVAVGQRVLDDVRDPASRVAEERQQLLSKIAAALARLASDRRALAAMGKRLAAVRPSGAGRSP